MKRFARNAWLLVPLVMMAACEDEVMEPEFEPTPEELAITDPDAAVVAAIEEITNQFGLSENASLTAVAETDEAPAFGSSVFADAFAEPDAPVLSTDMATDTAIVDIAPDRLRMYNVLAVWGRIRPNDSDFSPIQWDPALHVAEGDRVRVRRELLFEDNDEVLPQEARNLVEMTSWTGPHVDGVVAQVAIIKPDVVSVDDVAPPEHFLSFRSDAYSVQIPSSELGGLRVAEVIDDTGNGVLLAAVRQHKNPCGAGFMKGRWARTSDRGGVFGGAWIQVNGRREGYLAGRWGVNADGDQVFRAKIVNGQGQFLAVMAGTYGDGVYEGEIYGRGRVVLGHVKGRYTGEDGQGSFLGAWKQACGPDEQPDRICHLTDSGVRICTLPPQPEPTG
ncbi:MAG: hypothetical protein AAF389_21045 [Gemmatimonadota bacterium]